MNKAGGSAAFGRWASRKIKTRVGAQLATVVLGVLIFIDDYFNCLTVGSVMRPVTDKHHVSRAKLAYLIDATAAPVCIIAPISSWAAAVSGFVEGEDGLALFIQAIPFNFYALLTIAMMIGLAMMKVDFGPMALHERNALKGDLFTTPERPYDTDGAKDDNPNGSVIDLLIPIVCLIVCCVGGMLYTGGFFSGTGLAEAFAGSNASVGLMLGSFFALVITIVLFLIRRVMTFGKCMNCLPEGFKAMVPAILILTFAWTLKSMTDDLAAGAFVAEIVKNSAAGVHEFSAGCDLPHRLLAVFRHRHLLGNLRHSDPHCGGSLPAQRSSDDDYCHLRLHGGSGLRGPLLPYLGHHHYVLRRRPVQATSIMWPPSFPIALVGRCPSLSCAISRPALQRAPWFPCPSALSFCF